MNFHTEGCGSRSPPAVIQLGTKRLENNYRSDPVPAISSPTLTTLYSTRHTSITYSGYVSRSLWSQCRLACVLYVHYKQRQIHLVTDNSSVRFKHRILAQVGGRWVVCLGRYVTPLCNCYIYIYLIVRVAGSDPVHIVIPIGK